MYIIFNLSIFISAFLLFLIQPMTANILLPKVGGSPNIWNTCTVFFQISLLTGYAYSYFVSNKFSLKKQLLIHSILLFSALFFIRFHFQTDVISVNHPISETLISLFKNVFFPFVLLSTTSPLLQRWLSLSDLKERTNPYFLYVCSNIGSISSLYAYPLFFEKTMTASMQGITWHVLFAVFFCTVLVIAFHLKNIPDVIAEKSTAPVHEKTAPVLIFYWIFFAFVPSSLMLGVTGHLSTDIGGMPFLWILPLSLYLLSFIFTFSKFYTPKVATFFKIYYKAAATMAFLFFFCFSILTTARDNLFLIACHCLFYFIFATYCHGVLAAKKPSVSKLTLFYLCLSVGGALGGVFNTFIAPEIFPSFVEYPFILAISLPFIVANQPQDKPGFIKTLIYATVLAALFFLIPEIKPLLEKPLQKIPNVMIASNLFLITLGLVFIFTKKKNLISLTFFVLLFLLLQWYQDPNIIFQKRNFFGTITVKNSLSHNSPFPLPSMIVLEHGSTAHGSQIVVNTQGTPIYSFNPDAYYGPDSAAKDFFNVYSKPFAPVIAWLGLGSGATICYPQKNSQHDIFEIDQDIVDISTKYRYFRYLEHCAPTADIKVGDARMEIAKESEQKYDLIVVDVFSSHFIPVHLTTKEALETYRSKLKSDGLILFHISSRAFDIEPILAKAAAEIEMTFITRLSSGDKDYPQWGVLANNAEIPEIKQLLSLPGWRIAKPEETTPLWTDDFHNLLSAMRR